MFKRRPPPTLTEDAYSRWLRAGRPQPLVWFLGQGDDVQETLAQLGDDHAIDTALAVGYAVQDPQLAEAGMEDSDESDETIARRVATKLAADILGCSTSLSDRPNPPKPSKPSMAGALSRQAEKPEAKRQLFGEVGK